MADEVRTRFAPSPTGYLHLGGLRTALYTYLFARKHGGKFILRIEDTDQEREVPGAVDLIYKSMRQAGLDYDEGPDVGGEYGPYVQTQRRDLYPKYAWELVEKGGAYCCFCTKEELDAVAVTNRPGLLGSLLVGVNFGKCFAETLGIPFIGIDHIRAHLYASQIENPLEYPYLGVLVSGGHTVICKVMGYDDVEVLGTTIDDAIGEAFDKVAKFYEL